MIWMVYDTVYIFLLWNHLWTLVFLLITGTKDFKTLAHCLRIVARVHVHRTYAIYTFKMAFKSIDMRAWIAIYMYERMYNVFVHPIYKYCSAVSSIRQRY